MLTPTQKKQIEYADKLEFNPALPLSHRSIVQCKTCGELKEFSAPSSAIYYIKQHSGHKTWYTTR
jgi:hypothetical protein